MIKGISTCKTDKYIPLVTNLENLNLRDREESHQTMPPQKKRRTEHAEPTYDEEPQKTHKYKRPKDRNSKKQNHNPFDASDLRQGFSLKKCKSLFQTYSAKDDSGKIGPDGMLQFCKDLGVNPENIVMLVLAWHMKAKQMGYFSYDEWCSGLEELQCDSIAKLKAKLGELQVSLSNPATFKSVYRYAFDFSRDKDQRSLDIDVALTMLRLLLQAKWELFTFFQKFLEESKHKVINKDQWYNILEFSRSIKPDLTNYDEDGAWPVLLDEFVEWYKKNRN